MITVDDVAELVRVETARLDFKSLREFALAMGVSNDVVHRGTREEIIQRCIALEQYTFVH